MITNVISVIFMLLLSCKSNSYFRSTLKLQKDEQRVLEVLPQIGFKANDIYTYRDTNYSELETALTEREVFVFQF